MSKTSVVAFPKDFGNIVDTLADISILMDSNLIFSRGDFHITPSSFAPKTGLKGVVSEESLKCFIMTTFNDKPCWLQGNLGLLNTMRAFWDVMEVIQRL